MTLEIITLRDSASGATASILPGLGFNCYSFRPVISGEREPREVLWSLADFASGNQRASRSGMPILFPFPGRLRGKTLDYDGRHYALAGYDDGHGNAIHGFVLNRPWAIVERTESAIVGRFHAASVDRALLEQWPADFELTVGYTLTAQTLAVDITVRNPDVRSLPWGLGLHPWFRVPLDSQGRADDCLIAAPVAWHWPLADMLPTGERRPVADQPLAHGLRFGEAQFDDVFTNNAATDRAHDKSYVATVTDPVATDLAAGRRLTIEYSPAFTETVVFTPQHREAVCIEPYTCAPNAYELAAAGHPSGLRVLPPGESCSLRMTLRLE